MEIFDQEKDYVTSVSKYLKIFDTKFYINILESGRWMYRGHEDYTYKLKPSIGRLSENDTFKDKLDYLYKFEKQAFNEFMISSYNEHRENNQFLVLAIAQHHGLKTRLLDWTFSPLIALFFAVENERTHNICGSIIAFQTEFIFNDTLSIKDPFDITLSEYHYLRIPSLSPRIKAQQGVFQLFKNPTLEFDGEEFKILKYIIPAKCKKVIKQELYDLGITYSTVFPDWDGFCRSINYFNFYYGN